MSCAVDFGVLDYALDFCTMVNDSPQSTLSNGVAARHRIMTEDLNTTIGADLPWSQFDGATVMVSGASGFIGSNLVETLLYRNVAVGGAKTTVVALARNHSRAAARFSAYSGRKDLHILHQDVVSPIEYTGELDFVIHAASNATPQRYTTDPVGTHLANTLGTYNLLRLASEHSCRSVLFVSSGDVYGVVPGDNPMISEHTFGALDPMQIRSCYGESKRAGENLCSCWTNQYGMPTKVARLSHTYGPGIALDDGRVFADFVACAVAGKDIVLTSNGSATRPFCYITDAVIGLFTIMLLGTSGEAYNLANDEAIISVAELAQVIADCVPESGIKPVFDASARPPGYVPSKIAGGIVDTRKIRALGWKPTVTPRIGFSRMIASYRKANAPG
jgi:UDP-glucuronate decarboxylase